MKPGLSSEKALGMASAASAYLMWGILPIYWKSIYFVPSSEILAHRVVWSFLFMVLVLLVTGKIRSFISELYQVVSSPKQIIVLVLASFFISVNWLTYIWAVSNNRVIETSLGYYINPLVSVLLGIIVLKERLSFWQLISLFLATIGVLNITMNFGSFPLVGLLLAISFGLYGLLKKFMNLGAVAGITSETLMISPFALIYLVILHKSGYEAFGSQAPGVSALLMGAGIVTAVPLILFSAGARRLSLSAVGFLQYIAPSIALVLGVFLYHEPFTAVHLVSFIFIWAALTIFSLSGTRPFIRLETIIVHRRQETGDRRT